MVFMGLHEFGTLTSYQPYGTHKLLTGFNVLSSTTDKVQWLPGQMLTEH